MTYLPTNECSVLILPDLFLARGDVNKIYGLVGLPESSIPNARSAFACIVHGEDDKKNGERIKKIMSPLPEEDRKKIIKGNRIILKVTRRVLRSHI